MATNPFSGTISTSLKDTFDNAIKSLLEDGGGSTPCRLIYGATKFTLCSNCIFDAIGKKSSNRYLSGGPVPFTDGQICPMCNGIGRIPQENTENINLVVIWDYKSWIDLGVNVNAPEGFVQTISEMDTLPKIKRTKDIIINTDIEKHVRHAFVRHGEPAPAGLGRDTFVVTMWKRSS